MGVTSAMGFHLLHHGGPHGHHHGHQHEHHNHHNHGDLHHGHTYGHGHDLTPEDMAARQQTAMVMQCMMLLFLVCAFLYAFFERRRRRAKAAQLGGYPARQGDYTTGLFDCICQPNLCLQSSLFAPILAAFNRAEVENRDCHACDALSAICCTPCAIAQDTIEMERRAALAINTPVVVLPVGGDIEMAAPPQYEAVPAKAQL